MPRGGPDNGPGGFNAAVAGWAANRGVGVQVERGAGRFMIPGTPTDQRRAGGFLGRTESRRSPFAPATAAEVTAARAASRARSDSPEAGPNRRGRAPLPATDATTTDATAKTQTDKKPAGFPVITASSGTQGEQVQGQEPRQGRPVRRRRPAADEQQAAGSEPAADAAEGGSRGGGKSGRGSRVAREDDQPRRSDRPDDESQRSQAHTEDGGVETGEETGVDIASSLELFGSTGEDKSAALRRFAAELAEREKDVVIYATEKDRERWGLTNPLNPAATTGADRRAATAGDFDAFSTPTERAGVDAELRDYGIDPERIPPAIRGDLYRRIITGDVPTPGALPLTSIPDEPSTLPLSIQANVHSKIYMRTQDAPQPGDQQPGEGEFDGLPADVAGLATLFKLQGYVNYLELAWYEKPGGPAEAARRAAAEITPEDHFVDWRAQSLFDGVIVTTGDEARTPGDPVAPQAGTESGFAVVRRLLENSHWADHPEIRAVLEGRLQPDAAEQVAIVEDAGHAVGDEHFGAARDAQGQQVDPGPTLNPPEGGAYEAAEQLGQAAVDRVQQDLQRAEEEGFEETRERVRRIINDQD